MDQETLGKTIGWAGGMFGGLMGILGGVIGTYFSVKNTKGPRERAFVIRASIGCWIAVSIFVLGMWLVPSPYKFGLIPVYVVALLFAIHQWNKRQAAIRVEESNPAGQPDRPA